MHRLSVVTALLVSFVAAYATCVWATSSHPIDFFEAQASPMLIRGSD